jgi:N-acetyl-anhydromuramyl-L-alanine amidase AmpD
MIDRPSPNSARRVRSIRCIVLHSDASPGEEGTLSWLASEKSGVSYHVLIGRQGTAYRLVSDDRIAYHAGQAEWRGEQFVNAISLGLAFAHRNDGKEPYTAEAVDAARVIVAAWCQQYGLDVDAITTHAAVARPKGRKNDPRDFDLTAFRASVQRTLAAASA